MKDQDWQYLIKTFPEIYTDHCEEAHIRNMDFQGQRGWECFHIRQNLDPKSDRKGEIYYYYRKKIETPEHG